MFWRLLLAIGLAVSLPLPLARAEAPSRAETVQIAERYASFTWIASPANMKHGRDTEGVEVNTPDVVAPAPAQNVGMPYKWGGFDSIERFERGVKAGKAAGDIYTAEKRRLGGRAVSAEAVGIDCSGFISRCWKLAEKHSTESLPALCQKLSTPADLKPGDIMNTAGGHVILFAKWLDEAKMRALFYEAAPFSKVTASEREIAALVESGFTPLRYRRIRKQ